MASVKLLIIQTKDESSVERLAKVGGWILSRHFPDAAVDSMKMVQRSDKDNVVIYQDSDGQGGIPEVIANFCRDHKIEFSVFDQLRYVSGSMTF